MSVYSYNTVNGLNLAWTDVNVVFKSKSFLPAFFSKTNNDKHILKNQNGKLSSGELVGLLGSSGSGKTTLLNTLSFRKVKNLKTTGSIKINGVEMNGNKMHSVSAYVEQDDLFIGTLTVREHLIFHAMLRMHKDLSRQDKIARVDELMHDLLLLKCEHSVIGIAGRLKGISGGEKKRLSFATEILNNPMILFCDEPTSGLDASMAYTVVECLKKIAKSGKSVLCTIHQPSSETYLMFDSIYVLYDGSLALAGSNTAIINFLSTLNMRLPANYNPADFVLNVLGIKPNSMTQDIARGNYITQAFQQSSLCVSHLQNVTRVSYANELSSNYLYDYIHYRNNSRSFFLVEVFYVFKRNIINFFRDRNLVLLRLIQILVYSLLIGFTFFRLKTNDDESLVICRVLFLQLISVSLVGSLSAITFYPQEYPILEKDNYSRVYRVISYFLGNILFEIPFYVLFTIIFDIINYWLVGLNPRASSFFINVGWLMVVSQVSVAFGHLLAAFAPSPYSAVILFMPGLMGMVMMTTFFLTNAKSPLGFMKYMSWIHYALCLLMLNEWESKLTTTDCINCGSKLLDFFKVYDSLTYVYIIGLFASYFVWRGMAYIVTLIRLKYF